MFTCELCKKDKEGRKYVYASSTRRVKILVCSACHAEKVNAMNAKAAEVLGTPNIVTGVLQPSKEE